MYKCSTLHQHHHSVDQFLILVVTTGRATGGCQPKTGTLGRGVLGGVPGVGWQTPEARPVITFNTVVVVVVVGGRPLSGGWGFLLWRGAQRTPECTEHSLVYCAVVAGWDCLEDCPVRLTLHLATLCNAVPYCVTDAARCCVVTLAIPPFSTCPVLCPAFLQSCLPAFIR
jgi:hypothetical protein